MAKTAKSDPDVLWWLYLLTCATGRIYVGISPDPLRRFRVHCRRTSANTRMNRPIALIGAIPVGSFADAVRAERAAKRLCRNAKLELANRSRRNAAWDALVSETSRSGIVTVSEVVSEEVP